MYMMSRDHISMHIDAASLQLMLQLLNVDRALQSGRCTVASDDDELARLQHRLLDIVNQSVAHTAVSLDNMTVSLSVVFTYIYSVFQKK